MNRSKTALHLASGTNTAYAFNNAIKVSMRMQFFEFLSPFLSHSRHHPTLKSIRETAHGCRCLQLKSKNKMHIITASTPMSILYTFYICFFYSVYCTIHYSCSPSVVRQVFFFCSFCLVFTRAFSCFSTCTQTVTNTSITFSIVSVPSAQCIDDAHCTLNAVLQLQLY